MAFIVNKMIVNGQEVIKPPVQEEPVKVVTEPVPVPVKVSAPIAVAEEIKEHTITYDHNILKVDGKEKKIGKHSAYLLDMLTLDD